MLLRAPVSLASTGGQILVTMTQEVAKVLFKFTFDTGEVASIGAFASILRGIKVTASLWVNGSRTSLYDGVTLLALQELQTAGEGVVPVVADTDGSILSAIVGVDLGSGGAIDLPGDAQFDIQLTGVETSVTGTITPLALQSPVVSVAVPEVATLTVQADTRTERHQIDQYSAVAIPLVGFERITLSYSNGRDMDLTPDDLAAIQASTNDLLFVSSSITSDPVAVAASDHCVIETSMVKSITIQKAEGTAFRVQVLRNIMVGNFPSAATQNNALVPTA